MIIENFIDQILGIKSKPSESMPYIMASKQEKEPAFNLVRLDEGLYLQLERYLKKLDG